MPRHNAADARRTRERIVVTARDHASIVGLDGLTIGPLAAELGLSKAGVVGPFGSRERLQLAALRAGIAVFRTQVWEPVAALPAGRERLRAACQRWLDYLEDCPLPGGCMIASASSEWDSRPGRIRELVVAAQSGWLSTLAADAEVAIRARELPPNTDPGQLTFEVAGIALALNQALQLFHDPAAAGRARAALARLLG